VAAISKCQNVSRQCKKTLHSIQFAT